MALSIIVCIKAAPESNSPALLDSQTNTIRRADCGSKISTLDRHALAAAVALKNACGGSIIALSMGPESVRLNMLEALALGADEAYLLSDKSFAGGDTLATSRVLAAAVRKLGGCDLLLCGAYSDDGGTAQVPAQLAEWLGLPHLHQAVELAYTDGSLRVTTAEGDCYARWLAGFPLLLSVDKRLNRPAPARMRDIRLAKTKPLHIWRAADLPALRPELTGLSGSPTQFGEMRALAGTRSCQLSKGKEEALAEEILNKLAQSGLNLPEYRPAGGE